MRSAIWVLNIFAAIWGVVAFAGFQPHWLMAIPVAISAGLIFRAQQFELPERSAEDERRAKRLVMIWSAVEGVAIFLAANFCINFGAKDAVAPAIAIIVGLHFLPLAHSMPVPLYYATGILLILVGGAALLFLPEYVRTLGTGLGSAIVLWGSGLALARRRIRALG